MKNVIIILTSGRSGSSLLVKMLEIFNFDPGAILQISRLVALFKKSNLKGHFENLTVLQTNEYLLNKFNSPWFSIKKDLKNLDNIKLTEKLINKAVDEIIKNKNQNIVIKDPRLIYFVEYWVKYFSAHNVNIKLIYLYRKPQDYIHSLMKRDSLKKYEAEGLWLSDNYQIIEYLKNKKFLSLSFDQLQEKKTIEVISKFLNQKINKKKYFEFVRFNDTKLIRSNNKLNYNSKELLNLYQKILLIPFHANGHKITPDLDLKNKINSLATKQNKSKIFQIFKKLYFIKSKVRPIYTNHKFKL